MKTLLLIGLIYTMLVTLYRFIMWLIATINLIKNDKEFSNQLKTTSITKKSYIIGGLIEYPIIFATLIGALILIY